LRDELLQNFDSWGKIVTPELKAMPERFPLSAYVADAKKSLKRIEAVLAGIDKEDMKDHVQLLQALQAELGPAPGTPCVYTHLEPVFDRGLWQTRMDFTRFPIEAMAELTTSVS
jgi:hypothetical protein